MSGSLMKSLTFLCTRLQFEFHLLRSFPAINEKKSPPLLTRHFSGLIIANFGCELSAHCKVL